MDFTLWPSTVISESSSMVQPVDSPPMAMARVSLPVAETDFAGFESVEDWGSAELGARSRRSDRRNFVRMGLDYRTNERGGEELRLGRKVQSSKPKVQDWRLASRVEGADRGPAMLDPYREESTSVQECDTLENQVHIIDTFICYWNKSVEKYDQME